MDFKKDRDQRIKNGDILDFGIVVFDLNDLKIVNDTYGHEAGDQYIKSGSRLICNTFKHSPVFRIGGDEFVTLLEGSDYSDRKELIERFNRQVDLNLTINGVVVAAGMETLDPNKDTSFDEVFERADQKMYARKNDLKQRK